MMWVERVVVKLKYKFSNSIIEYMKNIRNNSCLIENVYNN